MGFIAPFGYKKYYAKNRITLEIDEYASKIVKRIFSEVACGISKKEIAKKLNEEKIITPMQYMKMTKSRNKNYYDEWSDKMIYKIIRNHTYTGDNVVRKSVKPNYKQHKRNWVAIRDREIIKNTHPAIISETLFNKANLNIKELKRKQNRIKDYKGALNGLVICGQCNSKMSVTGRMRESGNVHYHFYCGNQGKKHNHCDNNRKISDSILNKIVYNSLKEIIDKYANKEEIVDKTAANIIKKEEINHKIKNVQRTIESYNNNIRNLYIKKTKDEISLDEFLMKKDLENNKKEEMEKELKNLLNQKEFTIRKEELEKKYSEFMSEENIYKYGFKDLIKKVILKKDRSIVIEFNFGIVPNRLIQL